MIYYLQGEVIYLKPLFAILKSSGVGYGVHIPLTVSEKLKVGEKAKFFTRVTFSEKEQKLYGFLSLGEAEFFDFLCSLPGVGPALSFHLVSTLALDELLQILHKEDLSSLQKIPRIGKNRAEKILFEVKKKQAKLKELEYFLGKSFRSASNQEENFIQVKEALLQLGFKVQEIERAKEKIQKANVNLSSLTVQDLIRIYLRYI